MERAFSARKEAAAARVSGCEVDGGGGGANVDDDILFFVLILLVHVASSFVAGGVVWVALWGW